MSIPGIKRFIARACFSQIDGMDPLEVLNVGHVLRS
jgi:hypothetical protein